MRSINVVATSSLVITGQESTLTAPSAGVMGGDRNTVHLLTRDGKDINVDSWPVMTKEQVATGLVAAIAKTLGKTA